MSSSATGVGMTICFLGAILLILTQKSSQKFGDVLGIMVANLHYLSVFQHDNLVGIPNSTESVSYDDHRLASIEFFQIRHDVVFVAGI